MLLLPTFLFVIVIGRVYWNLENEARLAAVRAMATTFAVLVAMTELLSLFDLVTRAWLTVGWCACLVGAGALLYWVSACRKGKGPAGSTDGDRNATALTRSGKAATAAIGFSLGTLFLIAVLSAPNNWDSMTYHLPRVMNWIENKSLDHFPARDHRLLEYAPGAEIGVLHIYLLWGGDRLANLVQWSALAGCLLVASLLAKELGAKTEAQIGAALFCVSMPMAILQATSTQNDLVVSFWFMTAVLGIVRLENAIASRGQWLPEALLGGVGIGLAILSKGTAFVYLAPFVFYLIGRGLFNFDRRWVLAACMIVPVIVALNAGWMHRNYSLYGRPIRSGLLEDGVANPGLQTLTANIIRNAALQLNLPTERGDRAVERLLDKIASSVGVDLNNPDATYGEGSFFLPGNQRDEDFAANPLHFCLVLLCLPLAMALGPLHSRNIAALIIAGALLFCLLIRWQVWGSRLHLGFLLLSAPVCAAALDRLTERRGIRFNPSLLIGGILFFLSFPWLFFNQTRPLIGGNSILTVPRERQYFAKRPDDYPLYREVADYLLRHREEFDEVGLVIGGDRWEYPLRAFMAGSGVKFPQMLVPGASARLERRGDPNAPDLLLFFGDPATEPLAPEGEFEVLSGGVPLTLARYRERQKVWAPGVIRSDFLASKYSEPGHP